jgi:hypothetical protein
LGAAISAPDSRALDQFNEAAETAFEPADLSFRTVISLRRTQEKMNGL